MSGDIERHDDWRREDRSAARVFDLDRTIREIARRLTDLENELREQASGSQDGYLLHLANRLRDIRINSGFEPGTR